MSSVISTSGDREALLLINMGGPDNLGQVKPFLQAIFRDSAILPVPSLVRYPLAELISSRRSPHVAERYRLIGGNSPLHRWTLRLRDEVEKQLKSNDDDRIVAYAFRYSPPTIKEAMHDLSLRGITSVRVLPLFPHYTSAMTGSVLSEIAHVAERLDMRWSSVPAWGNRDDIFDLWTDYLSRMLDTVEKGARVLFVAHGIPKRNVRKGEDYPKQVMQTARSLAERLPNETSWSLAYQSKVGPVEWTRPYLEEELDRLCMSKKPIIIMPLSFAADCLETLYDLDHLAIERARRAGVKSIARVRVFNDDPRFARIIAVMLSEECHVE